MRSSYLVNLQGLKGAVFSDIYIYIFYVMNNEFAPIIYFTILFFKKCKCN